MQRKSCKTELFNFQVLTLSSRLIEQPAISVGPVHGCPLAGGESPEGNKAGGGGFVEGAVGVVGGEVFVVEGVRGRAARYGAGSPVELETDGAGDGPLGFVHKGVEGGFQGRKPEAFVGKLCVALLDGGLESENVLGEGEGFELSVGLDDGEGGGCFVDLAALYADETVLDHVYSADAVGAGDRVELGYELDRRQFFVVEARGQALREADLDVARLFWRLLGGGGELEDVLRRLVVGVFEGTGLYRAAPEVRVHAEVRGDGGRGDVEADLVVALAGRAVGDVGRPHLARRLDEFFRDERPTERGEERVPP